MRILRQLTLSLAIVVAARGSAAQGPPKVDLTGKWSFSVTTSQGTGTPTVTLKQHGDSLTGRYSSQLLGEADLKGLVKDGKFHIVFKVEVQGTALTVNYDGTVESANALKGDVDLGGAGSGTFTATRASSMIPQN